MDKFTKTIILLIGVGILFNILKERLFQNKKNEIIVAGHHVDKDPCMYAMNELFGRGIDSSKVCDCLIPKFYKLIKDDSSKIKKFEEMGFFKLEGALNDSATLLLGRCVSQNITDTSFKLDIEKFHEPFLKKLKDTLAFYPEFKAYNSDSLASCFFQSLAGRVTIKEYFSEDYLKVDKIKTTISNCLTKTK
jgi:hypothetical protein